MRVEKGLADGSKARSFDSFGFIEEWVKVFLTCSSFAFVAGFGYVALWVYGDHQAHREELLLLGRTGVSWGVGIALVLVLKEVRSRSVSGYDVLKLLSALMVSALAAYYVRGSLWHPETLYWPGFILAFTTIITFVLSVANEFRSIIERAQRIKSH